jgi:hypothetical protein
MRNGRLPPAPAADVRRARTGAGPTPREAVARSRASPTPWRLQRPQRSTRSRGEMSQTGTRFTDRRRSGRQERSLTIQVAESWFASARLLMPSTVIWMFARCSSRRRATMFLLVRARLDGRGEARGCRAHAHPLPQERPPSGRLQGEAPCADGRSGSPTTQATSRSGTRRTTVPVVSHSPMAGCRLRPTNRSSSIQRASCSSSENCTASCDEPRSKGAKK